MRISMRDWMLATAAALSTGSASAQEPVQAGFEFYRTQPTSAQWLARLGSDDLGAALAPIDGMLRVHLKIPAGAGLVVVEVQEGGRAARAGLKANDILLTLDGIPLRAPEDFLKTLKARGGDNRGGVVALALMRGGKPVNLEVKAEVRVALAPAAEEKPDYYIGTPVTSLDATYRAQLDIAEGTGLIVGTVQDGSPAAKAGLKPGDILVQLDGQPLPDTEALRARVQAKGPHPAKVQILREGKPISLDVTPERRKLEAEFSGFVSALYFDTLNANPTQGGNVSWLRNTSNLRTDFVANAQPQQISYVEFQPAARPAADVAKKLDDLTAQVQALTKAVELLRAGQAEKK